MAVEFYYEVRIKILNQLSEGKFEFIEYTNKFENSEPIVSRKQAFKRYQSYLDVILKKDGISDFEARLKLKAYNDIDVTEDTGTEIADKLSNGAGIFCVIREPINTFPGETKLESFFLPDEEFLIHGIGDIGFNSYDPNRICNNLEREFEYYKHYGYGTGHEEIEITFCNQYEWEDGYLGDGEWVDDSFNEPHDCIILKTPFNWSGYETPYWWTSSLNESEPLTKHISSEKYKEIINSGESNQVEFKPSLLYNFSSGKPGIGIKGIIAKTIASFLNSNGGLLFIGVSDNGQVQGLNHDFKLSGRKDSKDYFLLEFDQMLEHFLTFSVKSNVVGKFVKINEIDIFVVTVSPMKRRPIFLNGQFSKEFYIRGEASSRQLSDIEDITNYCIERFN